MPVPVAESVENPLSKERITFRKTGGDVFAMDISVAPGGGINAPDHIHPRQEERLRVVAGTARFRVDGRERTATAGEVVTVPAGVSHTWRNVGGDELQLDVEYRPGLASAKTFFRTYFGWAQEGKLKADGTPHLLDAAVLFAETHDFIALASPPLPLQRLVLGALAPIARLRGHRVR